MSAKGNTYNRSAKGRARYARYRASAKGQANEIRQHERHNPKRIFIGSHYAGAESKYHPLPREAVERHLFGLADAFRQRQAEEREAFRATLDDDVAPAPSTSLTNEQLAAALLPALSGSKGSAPSRSLRVFGGVFGDG